MLALLGLLTPESGLLALLPFPLWSVIGIVVIGFVAMVFVMPYALRRFKLVPVMDDKKPPIQMLLPVVLRHLLFFMLSGLLMAVLMFAVAGSL